MSQQMELERCRAGMLKRLQRATRRHEQLYRKTDGEDCVAIGDDFAAIIHELKQIVYDFKVFAVKTRQAVDSEDAYDMVNRWCNTKLSPNDRQHWAELLDLRDDEVHTAQVEADVKHGDPDVYGDFAPQVKHFVVQSKGKTTDLIPLVKRTMQAMSKFVTEIDTIK